MREIGILILVFAPLETYLRIPDSPGDFVKPAILSSLLLMTVGIILEAGGRDPKMNFPQEWIPTFVGAGVIMAAGIAIALGRSISERRHRRSGERS